MGIMAGWGPCLSFCAPIVLPLIAGTQSGWQKGLWSILAFSFSRVFAYIVLAVISYGIGHSIDISTNISLHIVIGSIIIILGVLMILNRSPDFKICNRFIRNPFDNSLKAPIILGLLIGVSPCVPLFGALAYIAFESKTYFSALFLGSCFGVGTLLTPLIPIGILAGSIPSLTRWQKGATSKVFDIFRRVCGGYLAYIGIKLL